MMNRADVVCNTEDDKPKQEGEALLGKNSTTVWIIFRR